MWLLMNGTLITENKVCVDEGDDLVRRLSQDLINPAHHDVLFPCFGG